MLLSATSTHIFQVMIDEIVGLPNEHVELLSKESPLMHFHYMNMIFTGGTSE